MGKGHTVTNCPSPKNDARIAENHEKLLGRSARGQSKQASGMSNQQQKLEHQISKLQAKLAKVVADPLNNQHATIRIGGAQIPANELLVNRQGELLECAVLQDVRQQQPWMTSRYDHMDPGVFVVLQTGTHASVERHQTLHLLVALNDRPLVTLLDSGSQENACSEAVAKQCGLTIETLIDSTTFVGLGGAVTAACGTVQNVPLRFGTVNAVIDKMMVVPDHDTWQEPIVTMDWLHRNKLNLFIEGGDCKHIEIRDVQFMQSCEGVFVPTQLNLSNVDQFEDKKEADARIESIVSDFDLNTLEVKLDASQGANV
jgi:hypothetical protein